jgi:Ulp1 family protease
LEAAYAVASKLCQLLESLDVIRPTEKTIHECRVPRQENGFDCGIHVLITAEILLQGACAETQIGARLMQLFDSNPNLCSEYRRRIAEDALLQATKENTKLSK